MDREILFRGKVTKVPKYMQDKNRMAVGDWAYGHFLEIPDAQIFDGTVYLHVDPATVGQFTGLCDKNGKKIFEGDIVKTHYANAVKSDFIETVVFHNGRFCANSKISETGKWWTSLADGVPHVSFDKSVYMESCKVIGNIHDNPELLKEESE
jgi:uncharacterized phage protein (TIGR01671 family)